MNKKEIIEKVKNLNLPQGKFVVYESCPLAALGIREANDVDLLVSGEVFKELEGKGWKILEKSAHDRPLVY